MANQDLIRIQRISREFRYLFTALLVCIPLLDLLYWVLFNHLPAGLIALPVPINRELSFVTLMLAYLVSLLPVSVAMFGVVTLIKLFRLYEHAIVFSAENVKHLHRLGYSLILWVISGMIFTTLISVVLTSGNPPGQRMIVAQFVLADFSMLIIGAIVVLISWVMDEGRKLAEEQTYTV